MSTRGKTPAAPPVYRPQPTPRVLQQKLHPSRQLAPQPKPAPQAKTAPAAPPVYRPQPTPRALQLKPAVNRPAHPPAHAPVKPSGPVAAPVYTPRPGALQGKIPEPRPQPAPRPLNRQTPPTPSPRPAPAALQPKAPPGHRPAQPQAHAQPIIPLRRPGNFPAPAPRVPAAVQAKAAPGGVVQLANKKGTAKTKSRARVTTGRITKPIKTVKKFCSKKDQSGRIVNVRGLVRQGNKRKRVATTKGKTGKKYTTTESSSPLNKFLKAAGILSVLNRFEGGHAIADVFGGPTARTNTFPLPHAFNTITYKKAEARLKKLLDAKKDSTMEVSIEYPEDPLEGFLTSAERNKLLQKVGQVQLEKLEDLFCTVPGWMAWEVNDGKGGHNWTDFDNIRKDLWPTGTRPDNIITKQFVKAVNNL